MHKQCGKQSERRAEYIDMDYYKVLEIAECADEEQIKQAYRRLAKKYHPDLNGNGPETEEKFKDIVKAYKVLSDASKRKVYDAKRRKPVIYGNPRRKDTQKTSANHDKSNDSTGAHCKTVYDKSKCNKTNHSETECGEINHNGSIHKDDHYNAAETKANRSNFTKNLERYFGFAFEEGKKIVKEQGNQEMSEDSKELAEILKMFMKMK